MRKAPKQERLYMVWHTMKSRCYNESFIEYKRYGAKGVIVCDEWKNDYKAFKKWAYENGYDENAPRGKCTIDRIDSNGDYCPENCRWVDFLVQSNNTSRNRIIEYQGEEHTMAEWAKIKGLNYSTVRARARKYTNAEDIFFNGHINTHGLDYEERRVIL